jgi:hypothetical protein
MGARKSASFRFRRSGKSRVQGALKLILEPIFEADFVTCSRQVPVGGATHTHWFLTARSNQTHLRPQLIQCNADLVPHPATNILRLPATLFFISIGGPTAHGNTSVPVLLSPGRGITKKTRESIEDRHPRAKLLLKSVNIAGYDLRPQAWED